MNYLRLLPAGVLCLGLFATGCPAKKSAPQKAPDASTPAVAAPAAPVAVPTPARKSPDDQIVESLGWSIGKRLGLAELELNKEQIDLLIKGLQESADGKQAPGDLQKIGPQIDAFMRAKQTAYRTRQRSESIAAAKLYFGKLKENKAIIELPSGLRYEIVQQGTGVAPTATDTVKVHYTGKLVDGTVFDSSVQRGQPIEAPLNRVIPGWTEGLQKIKQGGKIRLYIPSQLAYGDNGRPGIPPGATLIFDIELLDVKATKPAPVAPVSTKK
jgi:FKBP-type peptidyl-prolyl cis-trans isomerase